MTTHLAKVTLDQLPADGYEVLVLRGVDCVHGMLVELLSRSVWSILCQALGQDRVTAVGILGCNRPRNRRRIHACPRIVNDPNAVRHGPWVDIRCARVETRASALRSVLFVSSLFDCSELGTLGSTLLPTCPPLREHHSPLLDGPERDSWSA